jgi:hypothetical protein
MLAETQLISKQYIVKTVAIKGSRSLIYTHELYWWFSYYRTTKMFFIFGKETTELIQREIPVYHVGSERPIRSTDKNKIIELCDYLNNGGTLTV